MSHQNRPTVRLAFARWGWILALVGLCVLASFAQTKLGHRPAPSHLTVWMVDPVTGQRWLVQP